MAPTIEVRDLRVDRGGITVLPGLSVAIESGVVTVRHAGGQPGAESRTERIDAGTILWAAGVQASRLGQSLGVNLDRAGRVPVDATLRVPGHPEIFVLGDLAVEEIRTAVPGLAQWLKPAK